MLAIFEEAALAAGRVILDIYQRGFEVETKADQSPVTEADVRAEAVILAHLKAHIPDIPVIAEEQMAAGIEPDVSGGRFLLIDPLDGTREFINRNGEFTVNIALIEDGRPVAGIVYAPAVGVAYTGGPDGPANWTWIRPKMSCRGGRSMCGPFAASPIAVASRSYLDAETSAIWMS